jgi:hypothetical protein
VQLIQRGDPLEVNADDDVWYAIAVDRPDKGVYDVKSKGKAKKMKTTCDGVNIIWLDVVPGTDNMQLTQHKDWIPLASIQRWGHGVLEVDTNTGLFNIIDEDQSLKAHCSLQETAQKAQEERSAIMSLICEPHEQNAKLPQCQELLQVLFPENNCDYADDVKLERCTNSGVSISDCRIKRSGVRKLLTPVIGVAAPRFTHLQTYRCTEHNCNFNARSKHPEDHIIDNDYCRIGNYYFTDAAMTKIQLLSMDQNTGKQIRRAFLLTWGTHAIETMRGMLDSKRIRTRLTGKTATFLLDRLCAYIPGNKVFTNVQLLLYIHIIKPKIRNYDIALAVIDGQITRFDVTWGAAKYIYAAEANKASRGPPLLNVLEVLCSLLFTD